MAISLNGIVNVNVTLSPTTVYRDSFNTALIIGKSTVSGFTGVQEFNSASELLDAGFENTSQEYLAATVYFAQNPAPQKVYVTLYATSLKDTIESARIANAEWYVAIPTNETLATLTAAQIGAAATYVESCDPSTMLAITLVSSGMTATYADVITALSGLTRTIVQYDDSNSNKTAIAAIIGYALGKNKPNASAFNLAYKSVNSINVLANETATTLNTHLQDHVNVYVNQGRYYNIFRQGTMMSGDYFDEIMNLDMLVSALKYNVMGKLTTEDKVPNNEAGTNILIAAITQALDEFVATGFISGGVWFGNEILNLKAGDALGSGYLVQFDDFSNQTAAQRANRIAPTCYIAIKLSGAIEHVIISLEVSK